jgi:hypothetical protein
MIVRILCGFQWKILILDHFLCCGLSPSFSTNLSDCYSTLWPESFSRHSSLCIFSSCAVSLASSFRARRRFQTLSSLLLAAQWATRSVFCSSRSVRESSQFSFSFPSRFVCQVPWKNLSRLCGWVSPSRRQLAHTGCPCCARLLPFGFFFFRWCSDCSLLWSVSFSFSVSVGRDKSLSTSVCITTARELFCHYCC